MKTSLLLLTILFFASTNIHSQTITRDTVPAIFLVMDSTHLYDIYQSNGRIIQSNSTMARVGYRSVQKGFAFKTPYMVEGFEVYTNRSDSILVSDIYLDKTKKRFTKPLIVLSWGMPVNGFFKNEP